MRINPESLAKASSHHPWRVVAIWVVLLVAGIASADGRVVGLMPHPGHATEALTGPSDDGLGLFYSALDSVLAA